MLTLLDPQVSLAFVTAKPDGQPAFNGNSVIEADSEETVRTTLADDPWSGTHLVVDCLDAWTIRLDGR